MFCALPPVYEGKRINYEHFPDRLCAFVYRNWGMIEPIRLAKVAGTTEEEINGLAEQLGLPVPAVIDADWLKYGYITVIRANWHMLSYNQLCTLLGWDEKKLAYVLKEDDFLDVKLGGFKPDIPELRWHSVDASELTGIREATKEFFGKMPCKAAAPFSFETLFEQIDYGSKAVNGSIDRIVYSYCALYGDTFTSDIEYSFSDKLLNAYRNVGVNGIWCQAVLYTLVPFPFAPGISNGWEERLEGVRKLTERLDAYGIKLFLYLNEPRTPPKDFFDKWPHIQGDNYGEGSCLCTSAPEVQKYLYDSAALIAGRVPLLGGIITITCSENRTNCYSHRPDGRTNCPRCKTRCKSDVISEVNNIIYRGASSVNPNIKMIAWTWGWEKELTPDIIRKLHPDISVMCVSEEGIKKVIGGVTTSVIDYSISVQGPGEYAKATWRAAQENGHKAYAKCQFNNTWECSFVPFLPAFQQAYNSVAGLHNFGVDGMLLDWTLGGFPSPTFYMLSNIFSQNEIPTLHELYESLFPADSIRIVEQACNLFSEAFDHFPFHIEVAYKAPQNFGTANLFYPHPSGFKATMVGYPYDDTASWRAIFPIETFERQFRVLSETWGKGLEILRQLPEAALAESFSLRLLVDCAEAAYCHFRSTYLQTRFVRIRDGQIQGDVPELVSEEAELCLRLAGVQAHNPCIGYESSNHYFYHRAALAEKYVNCKYLLQLTKKIKILSDNKKRCFQCENSGKNRVCHAICPQ